MDSSTPLAIWLFGNEMLPILRGIGYGAQVDAEAEVTMMARKIIATTVRSPVIFDRDLLYFATILYVVLCEA